MWLVLRTLANLQPACRKCPLQPGVMAAAWLSPGQQAEMAAAVVLRPREVLLPPWRAQSHAPAVVSRRDPRQKTNCRTAAGI